MSDVLVADAEHRHNVTFENGWIIKAGCNAHGRRKHRDAAAVQPWFAASCVAAKITGLVWIPIERASPR